MSNPLWLIGLIRTFFPGRFFLARLTRVPLLGSLMDRWMFRGDRLFLLPKVQSIEINEPIEPQQQVVLPYRIVDEFIARSRRRWIMHTCICRESSGCRDYPVDLGCLFMGEAVMGIHPRLGRHATKEEAFEHVRRCRDAGLVHLIGRNRLDPLWLGTQPGDRLLTVCNCCPCCCLWRMLPDLHSSIAGRFTKLEGVTVRVNDACTGCGECLKAVCFVGAIRMREKRAVITDDCRGCGRCVTVCPRRAIQLTIDGGDGFDKSVEWIGRLVNVG
jgi:Pyruvate/2-oxoacid:ferredoxin oxidoreductase delta subunit